MWETISGIVKDTDVFVDKLFMTIDGSIWGRNNWDRDLSYIGKHLEESDTDKIGSTPILSKYNDYNKEFEFVYEIIDIPIVGIYPSDLSTKSIFLNEVILDHNDTFWVFSHYDGIYSFNPNNNVIKRHKDINSIVQYITYTPDGIIYFGNFGFKRTNFNGLNIFRYSPESELISEIILPHKRWPMPMNMLADKDGDIWFDSIARINNNGRVTRLIPNIIQYWWGDFWYSPKWAIHPTIMYESSNGYLWYKSAKGTAWFDPGNRSGCWFTTHISEVVEDQTNTLWFLAEGKLFSLSLDMHP